MVSGSPFINKTLPNTANAGGGAGKAALSWSRKPGHLLRESQEANLVQGRVWSEPVSRVKIPCYQGKYREFSDFVPVSAASGGQKHQSFRGSGRQIP